jgi:hypothetical protein
MSLSQSGSMYGSASLVPIEVRGPGLLVNEQASVIRLALAWQLLDWPIQ